MSKKIKAKGFTFKGEEKVVVEGVFTEVKEAAKKEAGLFANIWSTITSVATIMKDVAMDLGGQAWDYTVAGAKKVASFVKRNVFTITAGVAGATAAGFVTTSMTMAAGVGAVVAASVIAAAHVLIAKRKKQSVDYTKMVLQMMKVSAVALLTPAMAVYGFFGLTCLFDDLFYDCAEAFVGSVDLFVL
jgi:hypothetical protein